MEPPNPAFHLIISPRIAKPQQEQISQGRFYSSPHFSFGQ